MFKLYAIITTFNRKDKLEKLLSQLCLQTNSKDYDLKIVAVVDGSTDGTLSMLNNFFKEVIIVLGNGNWWYTKSINEGMKIAVAYGADLVLTLNDDVEIPSNYLSLLISDWKQLDDTAILNTLAVDKRNHDIITFSGAKIISKHLLRYSHFIKPFSLKRRDELSGIHEIDVVFGRGLLIPTKVLVDLNYFDQSFVQYGSDDDFGLRAKKKGYHAFITWNTEVFENTDTTSTGSTFNNAPIRDFIISYFDKYSINSLKKCYMFNYRHGNKYLAIFNVLLFFSITLLKKIRNIKVHKK